ncbi:MAG: F0F1 ATP synthase subunit epsilon [Dehalococcoidia bacterium]|nr:MAG: F0F1 ATP synthase subunit epsilon [Dehalococcoidia bacterium]
MATTKLEIVTAEREVYSEDVTAVIAEGIEGQMTILPKHAPLVTMLTAGPITIRRDGDEIIMAISGGFLEVRPEKVIILADACERCDEIDVERATAAKQRAEERLKDLPPDLDHGRAEASLRRSLARLRVAEKRRKMPGYRPNPQK